MDDFFIELTDSFLECLRFNDNTGLAFLISFGLVLISLAFCYAKYYENREDSSIRFKMLSYGLVLVLCFGVFAINLLSTWQIAIPATLIFLIYNIRQDKRLVIDTETEKQMSENLLTDKNIVFDPVYTKTYFLTIVAIVISILCHVSIYLLER